jgi:uncharacterized protein (DUF697 family)/tellurite resistance protein
MAVDEKEVLAGLRVLVCIAKADGILHEAERVALASALEGLTLPSGGDLDSLLDATIDFETELAQLQTPEAKSEAYKSAYAMAHADGDCSAEEQALLDRMRIALDIAPEERSLVERIFRERSDAGDKTAARAIADPEKRAAQIRGDVAKCSIVSALLGAFPVPGLSVATDLAVVALQVQLVRDIGAYWGQEVDKPAAKKILVGFGVGTGARIAVSNFAKLLPGWGSAVGATTAFASTYAVGKVVDRYFAKAGEEDIGELKTEFAAAQKEAKIVYEEQKDVIVAKQRDVRDTLDGLHVDLKEGRMTQADYEERVSRLG